jgi:cation-transporting ATPase I
MMPGSHASSALSSALAEHLPRVRGRRQRRRWVGHGRAHIEVRGAHLQERERFVAHVEGALAELEGVHWAEVNAVLGRVVVAFDDEQVDVGDLLEVIGGVEEAHGLDQERFPVDHPEHPADVEPLLRQALAIGADVAGLGLGLVGRALRANPVSAEMASLVSLVEATPGLRRRLESRFGHAVTDLGLGVGNAIAQGLAQGPFGLVVDITHRALVLDEGIARRGVWERREDELHEQRADERLAALERPGRPVALPPGPIERYADRAAAATLAAAVVTGVVSRDPKLMVTATVAGTPKAARLGREAFAARLGRDLARSGVLPMDAEVLRRLDRLDTVVVDADVLMTSRVAVAAVRVTGPHQQQQEEQVWLAARRLLQPERPEAVVDADGWVLAPAPHPLPATARQAARELRAPGRRLLGLAQGPDLVALVAVEVELDPLTAALTSAVAPIGSLVVAGRSSGIGARVGADRVVAGGTHLALSVRALQAEGAAVVVVSARQHEALEAADLGIGVPKHPRPPWGAHVITGRGLADTCRILQAVPAAHQNSRRATLLAEYGSGAGALMALAGPRAGATTRSLVAVNAAAFASLASGAWSATTVARRPEPVPAERTAWHALLPEAVMAQLGSSPSGLPDEEAARRHVEQPAEAQPRPPGVVRASLGELANPLTPALASGAGMSAAGGSMTDAVLIGAVMGVNALVGGVQRVGADRALRHLLDESAVRVRLRRSGAETLSTADRLVPGDVVELQPGDAVPADCRVLTAQGLEVDESSLTGESQLVVKTAEPTAATSVADRRSMLYAGTAVAAGTGTAAVVAVGAATELGRSEQAARGEHRAGGVQARLRQLTKVTVPIALGAGAAVIGGGLLRGRRLTDSLGTGVSLAVAAVPEGLPVVATIAQLGAARRLSRANALVRNPSTIEALGRVDVLCFDKTGTLTEGRIGLHRVTVDGDDQPLDALDPAARRVLGAGLRATPDQRDGEALAHPTDRAVVEGAGKADIAVGPATDRWDVEAELPFEPSRGYHAVLGRTPTGQRLVVKGAPEVVLPRCSQLRREGSTVALDEPARAALADEVERLARGGYRVLAVAEREASSRRDLREDRIQRLQFVGLLALTDPVRDSAAAAVRGLRLAGVEVLMLTGDHPSTAEAIAAELDLLDGRRVLTGTEIDALSDADLDGLLPEVGVFARVSPTHKVRIVAALQRVGRVVAVTGDGANDAPAIRLADVGIALGSRGTNAAKEAADVVVTDDRIETITDAILEGRAMWASVRDAISVLLGGNLGEIAFTVGTGLVLPGGSPLNARQLLLVNLLTDMLPSMALALRPPSSVTPEALLREGPELSLGATLTRDVVVRGILTAGAGMGAWAGGRMTGVTPRHAGTVALVGLVGAQLGQTFVIGWRSPLVVAASVASGVALAGIIQTPGVSQFFGCQPLGPVGWGIGLSSAAVASVCAPLVSHLVEPLMDR